MRMLKKCDRFREKLCGKQGWPGKSRTKKTEIVSETNQAVAGWLGTGRNKRTEGRKGLALENSLLLIFKKKGRVFINTPHLNSMSKNLVSSCK